MQNSIMLLKRAQASHATGDLRGAIALYEQALRGDPRSYLANYLMAIALYQAGQLKPSIRFFDAAIGCDGRRVEAHKDRGLVLLKLGDFAAAEASFAAAIRLQPNSAELHVNRGIALKNSGRAAESVDSYRAALALRPDLAEAHNNLGNSLAELGRKDEALASYEAAAALKPSYAEAWFNAGATLAELDRGAEAERCFGKAVALNPRHAEAHHALGLLRLREGLEEEALSCFDRAVESAPRGAFARVARGALLRRLGREEEALADAEAALASEPENVEALLLKATLLRRARRDDEAIALFDQAIALAPQNAEAYYGIGRIFQRKREFGAAAMSFDEAIKHAPDVAAYHYQRGQTLSELQRHDQALEELETAIGLKPDYVPAHLAKARILSNLDRPAEALAAFDIVRALEPDEDRYLALRFAEKMRMCLWTDSAAEMAEIISRAEAGERLLDPFVSLAYVQSPALQMRCAKMHVADLAESSREALRRRKGGHGKPTIGYFSGDFRDHATMFLMAEIFERHDRERFRFVGISFKAAMKSAMRGRVVPHFDAFHEVQDMSDREVLELCNKEGIDIAVDLMGFTRFSRPNLFAAGIAPVQVGYLGYPGTTGAPWMDYIIADHTLIPEDKRAFYTEKVAYLPNSYQPNDSRRPVADVTPSRAELGLPEDAFVFCCFNNSFKITPEVFACWMRILAQAPGSVLWLLAYLPVVTENLRREAERHGIPGDRLVFAKALPPEQHLARQKRADLFLDTLPYNAHTTTSDALWVGLPVLTRMGDTFASRVAASLNRAVGLPEMITETPEEYERLALRFYRDREALRAVREKLARNRSDAPLFDAARYTRDLETLYESMMDRHRKGLTPDHIFA